MSPSVKPFDEAKYKALMDGLECSEINLSSLERTNRIDSEFYKKQSISIAALMERIGATPITNYISVSDGNHMRISEKFIEVGIPYYRGQDIHSFFIENANPICIDMDTFNIPYMRRSHLKKGDVLLSIVGTIGESALVYSDKDATCSCKLAILRPSTIQMSSILAVYLKTKYGFDQIEKFKRGAVQMGLLLEDMNQILIPDFTDSFIDSIHNLIEASHYYVSKGKEIYSKMQQRILEILHYDYTAISSKCTTEKRLSESFGASGRLDAEYYQPKYDDLTTLLATKDNVKSLCNIHDKNYKPDDSIEYKYIELANVESDGGISGVRTLLGKDLPSRARRKVKKGQVIISSIEGSLQSCALITDEYDGALCSTGFYVIDSNKINSETLLVLFQSEPIQLLLRQGCSGTILTAIAKDELQHMPLPLINDVAQLEIAQKVQTSFALRQKADRLIKTAVHAVEIAIEHGDKQALKWLKEKGVES